MKIEMGKKYKTRSGQDVRIYAVDGVGDKKVHGAIFDGEGFYSNDWYENGMLNDFGKQGDFDLVEAKEDWEVLVEHFEKNGEPVFIVKSGEVCLCACIRQSEYNSSDYCNLFLVANHDGFYNNIHKKNIKIATLEDCKKYILEK